LRIATVCGTRPELIKLSPLVPLLDARFEHHYLFTGQHYSPAMVQVFLDELQARSPDRFLDVHDSDPAALTGATRGALEDERPDVVLVYGDTNSTLAASRAARDLGLLLVHLEAGIRSFDRSMPEELNRIEVDQLADLRLAPTGLATWYLTGLEGYDPPSCPAVGNTVIDAWARHRSLADRRPLPPGIGGEPYAALTLHRQATVDDRDVLGRLLSEIGDLTMPVVFPVHPRTRARVEAFDLRWPANVTAVEPMGYLDFCKVMSRATVLLTDSGGIQEEAVAMGAPCVTLRPSTERMETVLLGVNRLFDPHRDRDLAGLVADAVARGGETVPAVRPYGDGHTSHRVTAVMELLAGRTPTAGFPDELGLAGIGELMAAVEHISRRPA